MKPTTKEIYAILFEGKVVYIGQTIYSGRERLLKHLNNARHGATSNPKLYDHMRANDPSKYTQKPLELCAADRGDERERFWIKKYKTVFVGLNCTHGGISPFGPEHYLYGKRPAQHIIDASVAARIGKRHSKETKAKMSKAHKGKRNVTIMKKVICLETGKIFDSVTDAAASCGGAKTNISLICRNNKGRVKGLTFRFYEEGKDANRRKLE